MHGQDLVCFLGQMTRERIHFEVALLASVLLHATAVASFQHRELLARMTMWTPLARLISPLEAHHPAASAPAVREPEIQTLTFIEAPRTFMETTADQVTGKEPTDARYYSDKATVAANVKNPTDKTGGTPYLNGSETRMASAADAMASTGAGGSPVPPRPPVIAPPPTQSVGTPPALTEEASPQPTAETGLKAVEENKRTTLAQASNAMSFESSPLPAAQTPSIGISAPAAPAVPLPAQSPGMPGTPSNREITAMKSRLTASGVARIGVDAFNVESSPFGEYDQKMVRAVQSRWYALIEKYALYEGSGTVTITFDLREDGTVQNLKQMENSTSELLASFCEKAILDSTPFEPFPDRLRLLLGNQPRDASFTFYY
jgi:hypothetical protein